MKINIIVGSTRQGRATPKVAAWVKSVAGEVLSGADVEVVDLVDYPLPFFDEAVSPQYNPERKPAGVVKKWLDKMAEADGYVFVTPEYNRSYSAVLKNAIDYFDFQIAKKPVALVAHGSTGGAQAVSHLRGVIAGAQAVSVPPATFITGTAGQLFDDEGKVTGDIGYGDHALRNTLETLGWYAEALAAARS